MEWVEIALKELALTGLLSTGFQPADFELKNESPTSILVVLAKSIDVWYDILLKQPTNHSNNTA